MDNNRLYVDVLREYWDDIKGQYMDTTVHTRELIMSVHIIPYFSGKTLADMTPGLIRAYMTEKEQHGSPLRHVGGLSPSYILMHYKLLRASLRYAVDRGYIDTNPTDLVKRPRVKYKEITTFSSEELQKLIFAARPKWMGTLIEIAYRTGMRRGEIYGLMWEDIDLAKGFLTIRRTVSALAPGDRSVHPPKTRSSARRVSLDNKLISTFRTLQKKARSEWVMEDQYGRPLSPWYNTKYMAAACDSAGIPRRCFHTLRHTHATLLLGEGVNPKIVQERLGHKDIMITLTTYSHVLPTMQEVIVDIFNKIP